MRKDCLLNDMEVEYQIESFNKIKDMVACTIWNECPGGTDHVGVVVSIDHKLPDRERFLKCAECGLWLRKLTEEEAEFILALQKGEEPDLPVPPGDQIEMDEKIRAVTFNLMYKALKDAKQLSQKAVMGSEDIIILATTLYMTRLELIQKTALSGCEKASDETVENDFQREILDAFKG